VLEAGETIMVLSGTGSNGQSTWLQVAAKMADAYSASDLVGTWEVNTLATGPRAPLWGRARITIAPGGATTGTATFSDGETRSISETMSISPDGIVGPAAADPSEVWRGVMDAGKTVIVATDTHSEGTTTLEVFTRVE
jgi:hypothetical protein